MWCCICMGKTNAKYVFSKNPCIFRILNNFFKKTWTKTQSLLEVFITKLCFLQYICCVHRKHENTAASGWKYTFLRVYIGKNETRNARGRGVGALLLLLLLWCGIERCQMFFWHSSFKKRHLKVYVYIPEEREHKNRDLNIFQPWFSSQKLGEYIQYFTMRTMWPRNSVSWSHPFWLHVAVFAQSL